MTVLGEICGLGGCPRIGVNLKELLLDKRPYTIGHDNIPSAVPRHVSFGGGIASVGLHQGVDSVC